jgi:hypothetical protein
MYQNTINCCVCEIMYQNTINCCVCEIMYQNASNCCVSTATIVTRTCHNVTFYDRCLSCSYKFLFETFFAPVNIYVQKQAEVQGGSNMTGTNLWLVYTQSVPVIFEPPCISNEKCPALLSHFNQDSKYLLIYVKPIQYIISWKSVEPFSVLIWKQSNIFVTVLCNRARSKFQRR